MINKLTIFFSALLLSLNCFAGAENLPIGAKQAGMGNAAVAISDVWCAYHNQAGLAGLKKTTVSAFVSQGYLLKETTQAAVVVAYPTRYGTFAISHNQFGFKLYKEYKTGVSFSRKFGEGFRVGAQANLNTISLGENYGKNSLPTFEVGLQTKLSKNLWLGLHLYNLARASVSKLEKAPVIVRFGLNYTFNTNVHASIEYEKNWVAKPLFKAGLEYKLVKELFVRVGINAGSNVSTFIGAGYIFKQFSIDAACAFDQKLGTSPQLGLTYVF